MKCNLSRPGFELVSLCPSPTTITVIFPFPYYNDAIIKTQEDLFLNICTSHFIVRVRKGLLKVCMREGARDRTETAIFWPPLLWPSTLCLSSSPGLHNRRPRGPLCWGMAFFTASYQQLLWTPTQSRAPSPFGLVWLSLSHLVYNSVRSLTANSVLTELYNSPTSTQSPTRFLESNVLIINKRNNCHAVHRSLSSGASVYECTMGIFYLVPFHQPISAHAISSHNCHWNVSLPSGASPWNAFLAGSRAKIQHNQYTTGTSNNIKRRNVTKLVYL